MSDRRAEVAPLEGWRTSDGELIPFNEMSLEHVQRAFKSVQVSILKHDRKIITLFRLLNLLEDEADRRGEQLEEPDLTSGNANLRKVYEA